MEKTKDGWESCWGVNHLGHFLLTGLLIDRLVAGEGKSRGEGGDERRGGRVVNVTSTAYEGSKILWEDVNFEVSGYLSITLAGLRESESGKEAVLWLLGKWVREDGGWDGGVLLGRWRCGLLL